MKRVLMICGSFPPESDVGGLRPAMFCKYLPHFGWKPVVLTAVRPPDDPDYHPMMAMSNLCEKVKKIPVVYGRRQMESAVQTRSFFKRLRGFFCVEEAHPPGLLHAMLATISEKLSTLKIDAVWSTTPDYDTLGVGAYVSRKTGKPWVADFRDIAEQNDGKPCGFRERFLRKRGKWRRGQLLRSASAVVTVSDYHAAVLHRQIGRPVEVIHNGFDPEMFCSHKPRVFKYFSIVYMGRILNSWLQYPRLLFEALDRLVENPDVDEGNIDVCFYGTDPAILKDLLSQYKCHKRVRVEPRVAYDEVPKILCSALILLTLTNRGRSGILTTKVFEYLAARKPILCVPGDGGELDALLKSTNAGISCSSIESTVKTLHGWYQQWLATGTVEYHGRDDQIMKYSRIKQAGELANIFNCVTCGRK